MQMSKHRPKQLSKHVQIPLCSIMYTQSLLVIRNTKWRREIQNNLIQNAKEIFGNSKGHIKEALS